MGPGYKRGGFQFAQYKKQVGRRTSSYDGQEKDMYTLNEFEEYFFSKGMTREWAREEWYRRRSDTSGRWRIDVDPDCKLPRVQAFGKTVQAAGQETYVDDSVTLATKEVRNPKAKQVNDLVAGLGQELSVESTIANLENGHMTAMFVDYAAAPTDGFGAKSFNQDMFASSSREASATSSPTKPLGDDSMEPQSGKDNE